MKTHFPTSTHPFAEQANRLQYGIPYHKRRALGWKWTLSIFFAALIAGWFL